MEVENPGNPRMETRLGFGIGIGLDLWRYVTLVRTARGASRRAGVRYKAKPHGCCIFSMILHEAPSMETTTPKGEWFPCWVAEWSIMENMQQQMWFCFYPSPISINISIYVYNALRLTPEIWFWAMPFASFQIDMGCLSWVILTKISAIYQERTLLHMHMQSSFWLLNISIKFFLWQNKIINSQWPNIFCGSSR